MGWHKKLGHHIRARYFTRQCRNIFEESLMMTLFLIFCWVHVVTFWPMVVSTVFCSTDYIVSVVWLLHCIIVTPECIWNDILGNGSKTEALWCCVGAGKESCTSGKVSSSSSIDTWLLPLLPVDGRFLCRRTWVSCALYGFRGCSAPWFNYLLILALYKSFTYLLT